jgi:hypothetical protein
MERIMASYISYSTSWSRGAISLLSSFRSLGESLFGPGALCTFRPFRSFSMPFDVNLKSGMTLINSTSKNIPHKTAKNKNGHPWIDAELKKQIRRQQRLYKKMKKTGDPDIKKAYRKHKHHLQKLTRQAYWSIRHSVRV